MKKKNKASIAPRRMLFYLLVLGLLPVLFAAQYTFNKVSQLDAAALEVESIYRSVIMKQEKQFLNTLAAQHYAGADRFYIDKQLETMRLLKREGDDLTQLIAQDPSLPNKQILHRLAFLTESQNQLRFTEGVMENYANVRETLETLAHPVEVDVNDIQRILAVVEEMPIATYAPGPHPPQLLIADFRLRRKELPGENEVFLLEMKVIKREWS